jgi:hypothetical protein
LRFSFPLFFLPRGRASRLRKKLSQKLRRLNGEIETLYREQQRVA